MERLQDIPSCKALPLEVEDRELLCWLWSGYLAKSSYLCALLLEYLCVLCPTSLSPLGM